MILFIDLDGTLLDISEKYYQIYRTNLHSKDKFLLKYQFWEMKRAGLSDEEIFTATQDVADMKSYKIIKQELLEAEDFLAFDILQRDVKLTLESLSKYYIMYLVTLRKNAKNLCLQLKNFNIYHFFEKILSSNDNISTHKGYEQKIRLIQQYQRSNEDYIIGDSEADINCGKCLNMKTIGLISGIRNFTIMKNLSPDYILPDFSYVTQILSKA